MAKATIRERVVALRSNTKGRLRFISGKWFYNDTEIKNIRQYMLQTEHTLNTVKECQDFIDFYATMYEEVDKWPETKIVRKARESKTLEPLCFPLNSEQLMIIRKLIDGDEEKMFILTGVGGSGKSTFLNIVRQIFDNDVAACSISDLSDKFQVAEAVRHRLISSDELAADDVDNKTLKTMISQQKMQCNPKYEKPFTVKCQSGIIFCCNNPPKLDLDDSGMLRRIVYYAMDQKIKNPVLKLNEKKWSEDDLVNIAAHALALDTTNWEDSFKRDTREYLLKNNSVYLNPSDEYSEYAALTRMDGMKPFSAPRWREIKDLIFEWKNEEIASLPSFEELCEECEED